MGKRGGEELCLTSKWYATRLRALAEPQPLPVRCRFACGCDAARASPQLSAFSPVLCVVSQKCSCSLPCRSFWFVSCRNAARKGEMKTPSPAPRSSDNRSRVATADHPASTLATRKTLDDTHDGQRRGARKQASSLHRSMRWSALPPSISGHHHGHHRRHAA